MIHLKLFIQKNEYEIILFFRDNIIGPDGCRAPEGVPRISIASARTADFAQTTKFRAADADLARTRLLKILKN